jgi:2-dehydro-3-deoxyglucarate aldolase/4-hydroxy-2-oxoheptanedioate aldolase
MNPVKQKLRVGEVVFGQMVLELFTPGIGPMLAAAGMEFVIYDMEHGRCDLALASEMIASCRGSSIVPMVRVPDLRSAPLSRVLDLERAALWSRGSKRVRRLRTSSRN